MAEVVHERRGAVESSIPFFGSGLLHGLLLAWVAFGTVAGRPAEPKQNIYDMTIRGQEKRIVWYRLSDKLPEVRPAETAKAAPPQPLRAAKKFDQSLVAGARDASRAPRMVWAPAPETAAPKPQPLPNVIAVEQKPLVKPFTAPVPKLVAPAPSALPEAPQVTAKLGTAEVGPGLKPLVKPFARPEQKAAVQGAPALPEAPQVTAKLGTAEAGPGLKPLVKPFARPEQKAAKGGAAALPQAPEVTAKLGAAEAGPGLKPLVKPFARPEQKAAAPGAPALPDAPDLAGHGPALQLAIVGLDPARDLEVPAAPPPAEGGFSAGPKPAPKGAAADNNEAELTVPGLTARGGARDAQPTLVPKLGPPSMKTLLAGVPAAPPAGPLPAPRAAHVSSAPDPMLEGRVVYSIAIQMPNVTSYSGSWIVWFAEHERKDGASGEVRPPVPLRKVDPKYVASAAADGVQGVVRLAAIIRRNGHVDTIQLLRHLDDRLDTSAMESLAKWEFAPAERNGTALDVDAVFEIPFHLAPKPSK
jgi:protein TonB